MIVCAYYTEGAYENVIKDLWDSCEKLDIFLYSRMYVNTGKWVSNCALKPSFLLHCLDLFDEYLYTDADSVFVRKPDYAFDKDFHFFTYMGQTLSGTLYVTKRARPFIEAWEHRQQKQLNTADQCVMGELIHEYNRIVRFGVLPKRFIKVFDMMDDVVDPVIIHNQASREHKGKEEVMWPNNFPKKIRVLPDGSYYLVRRDAAVEKYMDEHYIRIPNERKWWDVAATTDLKTFKDAFKGKRAAIVGKGPSLDLLNQLDYDVAIAINEAVHTVERIAKCPVMVVQQDARLEDACKPSNAKTKLFLSHLAKKCCQDFENRIIYIPETIGLKGTSLSAQVAIELCKLFGVSSVDMLCFDACTNGNTDYARSIKKRPEEVGSPERFRKHKTILEKQFDSLNHKWVKGCTASTADDKPQQSP